MSTDDDKPEDAPPLPGEPDDVVVTRPVGAPPEPAAAPPPGTIVPADDLPPVPVTTPTTVSDLQAAVGVKPKPAPKPAPKPVARPADDAPRKPPPKAPPKPAAPAPGDDEEEDDDDQPKKKRRWPLVVLATAILSGGIATCVMMGRANQESYAMVCGAKQITAERGRSFPPWGMERMHGAAWKPIAIPPNAECTPHDTDDPHQLEGWYREALVAQANTKLSGAAPGDIDQAEDQLQQALLLTRAEDRRDQRREIERLLGDVTYWRGAAKVKEATAALEAAAKRFDEAANARPRNATDAGAWAEFARSTVRSLGVGPGGAGAPQMPPSGVPLPSHPLAPAGVALPVEGGPPDAGFLAPPPDAPMDLPGGGVLF